MAQTRNSQANLLIDTNTHPIQALGSQEGTGFVGNGNSADNTTAAYITGLKENEVYEITFTSSDLDGSSGGAENVYIRPGGVVSTAAVTTSSFLWPASIQPTIQIKLNGDQQSIGILAAGSTAVHFSWRRLT